MTTGDPMGNKPRLHLTTDGNKTCCGIEIPRIGTETRAYRIDESPTSLECERCFTDERRDAVRGIEY
jgi:hypothetical protein